MRLTVGLGLGALAGPCKPCASLIWYDFVFIRYLGEGREDYCNCWSIGNAYWLCCQI